LYTTTPRSQDNRDKAGESIATNQLATTSGGGSDVEDSFQPKRAGGFAALASAGLADELEVVDDADGGGGLMVFRFYSQ